MAAVSFDCTARGWPTPGSDPLVSRVARGARRKYGHTAVPREPFAPSHIRGMVEAARRTGSVSLQRAAISLTLSFGDLLRVSEVHGLRGSDVHRSAECIRFRVGQAKNQPEGYTFEVTNKPQAEVDVYSLVCQYMDSAGVLAGREDHFFMCQARRPQVQVALSTMHADAKKLICEIGLDPKRFGTHSAKRGGATQAARAGLSSSQIQFLGRWKSAEMPQRYTAYNSDDREKLKGAAFQGFL